MAYSNDVPELSVVIPTKNRPDLVVQSVASVLDAAHCVALEILVVDDAGLPPASEALKGITDTRLRILRNPGPHGPGAARNYGVAQAQSDIVLFLDDDDLLVKGYPAEVVGKARMDTSLGFGFCNVLKFLGTAAPLVADFSDPSGIPVAKLKPRRRLAGLGYGFWVRKSLFLQAGGIDTEILVNEDTEFSLRLLSHGAAGWKFDQVGVLIRQHIPSGKTGGHTTHAHPPAQRALWFEKILCRHAAFLEGDADLRFHLLRRWVSMLAKSGDWRKAWNFLSVTDAGGVRLRLALHFVGVFLVGKISRRNGPRS